MTNKDNIFEEKVLQVTEVIKQDYENPFDIKY